MIDSIWSVDKESSKEGITPTPCRMADSTFSRFGLSTSRFGPTEPVVPASPTVWQVPQAGLVSETKSVRPAWASSERGKLPGVGAVLLVVAATSSAAARALAVAVRITPWSRQPLWP